MKKFIVFFVFCALLCFSVSAYEPNADDLVAVENFGIMTYGDYYSYVPDGYAYTLLSPASNDPSEVEPVEVEPVEVEPVEDDIFYLDSVSLLSSGDYVVNSLAPVTPSDSSGLKSILLSLFGNYDPVVVEYTYTTGNGYTQKSIDISPDYPWLASALLFLLLVFSIFRAGGAVLCRR